MQTDKWLLFNSHFAEYYIEPDGSASAARRANTVYSCLTDAVAVFDEACVFVCICAAGIVSTGDENAAEGPVEKAHGEVQRRGRA